MADEWWLTVVYFGFSALTVTLAVVVTYWIRQTREFRGERTFLVLCSSAAVWSSLVAIHILTSNPTVMAWIWRLELSVVIVTAGLWFAFCSQYANRDFHRRRWIQGALAGALLTCFLAAVLNPWGLYYSDLTVYEEPFLFASAHREPLYFLFLLAPYSCASGGIIILTQFLFSTRRGARARLLLLVVGVMSIMLFDLLSMLDLAPVPEFEHASWGLLPFMLFMVIGVFRLGFLHIEPIARDKLVETLDDGMVVIDHEGRIVDYNPHITGLVPSVDDAVGDQLSEVFPELADLFAEHAVDSVVTDRVWLDADDGERHFSVRVSPLTREGSGGDLLGYSVLLRDITELERSRRELERQNEQLDQFASIVSHDLRNPLSIADGFTEILDEDVEAVADEHDLEIETVQERIERIERAHDRMGSIVDDILTLTQESRSVQETAQLDFATVTETAWANVDTADASLQIEQEGWIEADRSRLLSIFENLFRNSLDHVGPSVSVTTGLIESGFYIADDGPGIPEEQADRILDYGYTTSQDGTGLGLSIVETMAGSHGWAVQLNQEYDGGACFVFTNVSVDPTDDGSLDDPMTSDSAESRG